jgi:hypothetical protein
VSARPQMQSVRASAARPFPQERAARTRVGPAAGSPRALRRSGACLPHAIRSYAPSLTATRHHYAAGPSVGAFAPCPAANDADTCACLGVASPFVRTGVVMPQRDSWASALAPRLPPRARGSCPHEMRVPASGGRGKNLEVADSANLAMCAAESVHC